ncbi:anti-sigma regulatory factor [Brevibacillus dissolubilis]|uniref:anti-sigma regulatory factor n=1 Tax=Brevibacillus dissolubilis TaxID=1844116 RepID=UPI001115B97B|nr:anti-sigma regulatory factor [Brevibacillus dissolubilis]
MTLDLASVSDVISIRQASRETAVQLGFCELEQTRLVTAVSEIAMLLYENGYTASLTIQEQLTNTNEGITLAFHTISPDLPDFWSLVRKEPDTVEQNIAANKLKRLVDEFEVTTDGQKGVSIVLTKWKNP